MESGQATPWMRSPRSWLWILAQHSLVAVTVSFVFWLPVVVAHGLRREAFGGMDVLALSMVMPLLAIASFEAGLRVCRQCSPIAAAILSTLIIWIAGPTVMLSALAFSGGGFATADAPLADAVDMTLGFPVYTFLLSAYAGTILALVIMTLYLLVISVRGRFHLFYSRVRRDLTRSAGRFRANS